MLFDNPECGHDVSCSHSEDGPNRLRPIGRGELDDDFPLRRADVYVRWGMLTGRQKDHDAKATFAEDCRYKTKVTERMGLSNTRVMVSSPPSGNLVYAELPLRAQVG